MLKAPSAFALALRVERLLEQLSIEKLVDRLAHIVADAEACLGLVGDAATATPPSPRPRRRSPGRADR